VTRFEGLRKLLGHPLSIFSAISGSLTLIVAPATFSAFMSAVYASLGQLFTTVSVAVLTLPTVYPPNGPGDWLVIIVGVAFVGKLSERIIDNFQDRL